MWSKGYFQNTCYLTNQYPTPWIYWPPPLSPLPDTLINWMYFVLMKTGQQTKTKKQILMMDLKWRDRFIVSEWVNPANTKHLYSICTMLDQRRRRWADVVQMLYKCFVFAGNPVFSYTLKCYHIVIHCEMRIISFYWRNTMQGRIQTRANGGGVQKNHPLIGWSPRKYWKPSGTLWCNVEVKWYSFNGNCCSCVRLPNNKTHFRVTRLHTLNNKNPGYGPALWLMHKGY